jgi:hypothetical protein
MKHRPTSLLRRVQSAGYSRVFLLLFVRCEQKDPAEAGTLNAIGLRLVEADLTNLPPSL